MGRRVLVVSPPIFSKYLEAVTGIPTSHDYNKYLERMADFEYIVLLEFSEDATEVLQDPEELTDLDYVIRLVIPVEWSSIRMLQEVSDRIAILQGDEEHEVLWH